jgi:hypothetical protein
MKCHVKCVIYFKSNIMRLEFTTPIESFTEQKLQQAISAMPIEEPFNIDIFEPNDLTNRYVIRVTSVPKLK